MRFLMAIIQKYTTENPFHLFETPCYCKKEISLNLLPISAKSITNFCNICQKISTFMAYSGRSCYFPCGFPIFLVFKSQKSINYHILYRMYYSSYINIF